MYCILSILTGVVISIMVCINGELTSSYGNYNAAVIIHVVGVLFASTICVIKKDKIKIKHQVPKWAYLGGAIGVLTTLFNNYAFGRITMTSIMALGLLGQSISSVLLDSFGLLGLKKRQIKKSSAIGYCTALIGIFIMMDYSVSESTFAVLLSIGAGVTVVLSRSINARLSMGTTPMVGSLINHLVGLPICIILGLCIQGPIKITTTGTKPWMYLGGMFGVITVLLFNVTVPRVPAFRLTLLSFVGQIFAGVILDVVLGSQYSTSTFTGGLIIAAGLMLNMLMEQWNNYRSQAKE